MTDPAWRRWLLLAGMAALACGYVAAYALFVLHSEDYLARIDNAQAQTYSQSHPAPAPRELKFDRASGDIHRLGSGWNAADDDGSWSAERSARLELVESRGDAKLLRLHAYVYNSITIRSNRLEVRVNGTLLASVPRDHANAADPVDVPIPAAIARQGVLHVDIGTERCGSPVHERVGEDARVLCVLLGSVELIDETGD